MTPDPTLVTAANAAWNLFDYWEKRAGSQMIESLTSAWPAISVECAEDHARKAAAAAMEARQLGREARCAS